jgi:hypothetical protein
MPWAAPLTVDDDDDNDPNFEWITDRAGRRTKILRDGGTMRVSFFDAMRARGLSMVHDGTDNPFALNKPGPRFAADASLYDEVARAYHEAGIAQADAWRRGPGGASQDASPALGTEPAGAREGDPCTVRAGAAEGYLEGAPGHLARVDGQLVCVPDAPRRTDSMSAADAEAIKQRAYDEMCRAGEQAWKNLGQH